MREKKRNINIGAEIKSAAFETVLLLQTASKVLCQKTFSLTTVYNSGLQMEILAILKSLLLQSSKVYEQAGISIGKRYQLQLWSMTSND